MTSRDISVRQLAFIQFAVTAPTTLILLPALIIEQARHDALWSILGATFVGLIVNATVATAAAPYGPAGLFRRGFGPAWGRVATGVYWLVVGIAIVIMWGEDLAFVHTRIMPHTPLWAIGGISLGTVVILVRGRAVGLARMVDLLVPVSVGVLVGLIGANMPRIQLWNIWPWYPVSWKAGITAVYVPLSFIGESPIGVTFFPFVRSTSPRTFRRAILWGSGASALLLGLITFLTIGVLGSPLAADVPYPLFEVLATFRVGDFLTRNAIWFFVVWQNLLILKLAIWTYVWTLAGRALWPGAPRWLWLWVGLPVTLIAFLLTLSTEVRQFHSITQLWAPILFPTLIALILLGGLCRGIRSRQRSRGASSPPANAHGEMS